MPDYRTSRRAPARAYSKERKKLLADRVIGFYKSDLADKALETDLRLQRYAKLRGWVEGKDYPWPDSSDVAIADIMTASLRVQDTLHNAVMSGTPVVAAQATDPADKPKEEYVDALIDYQVFAEQPGELTITGLAQQFVEDGEFTAMVSWVKESRRGIEIRKFPPIPEGELPGRLFQEQVNRLPKLARMRVRPESEGWDWDVEFQDGSTATVRFYATDGEPTEMWIDRQVSVFNGPLIDQIDWDDIFYPARCTNLQIPGPSNKGGAAHVIIRSAPSIDEIARLVEADFYDLVTPEEMDEIRTGQQSGGDQEMKDQRDAMQGRANIPGPPASAKAGDEPDRTPTAAAAHTSLTVLRCFDIFDIDGDGQTEDIVCWVVLETGHLLRCKMLGEVYPFMPPRRPLAHQTFLPVQGSASGISLPELMEGYHDLNKILMDQTVDINAITGMPFFAYRAAGGNRPETLRLEPGAGIPLSDPQKDLFFPRMNNAGVATGLNLLTLTQAWQEKLTNIGDLQLGRVPVGRASALRTVGGMSMVAQQGEARPERILRRFFLGLADIWSMVHQLNQVHITQDRVVRVRAPKRPDVAPYTEVKGDDIRMQALFTFTANAYNASKQALQDALNACAAMFINPVALQAGTITPDGIYRFLRKYGEAYGIADVTDTVLTPPSPDSMKPKLLAIEVIHDIMTNQGAPDCAPLEGGGAQEHYAILQSFVASQQMGLMTPEQVDQLRAYMSKVLEQVRLQQRQAAMAEAMAQFAQARGGPEGGQGGPGIGAQTAANATAPPAQISGPGELMDESMPGAGGGANPGGAG